MSYLQGTAVSSFVEIYVTNQKVYFETIRISHATDVILKKKLFIRPYSMIMLMIITPTIGRKFMKNTKTMKIYEKQFQKTKNDEKSIYISIIHDDTIKLIIIIMER